MVSPLLTPVNVNDAVEHTPAFKAAKLGLNSAERCSVMAVPPPIDRVPAIARLPLSDSLPLTVALPLIVWLPLKLLPPDRFAKDWSLIGTIRSATQPRSVEWIVA